MGAAVLALLPGAPAVADTLEDAIASAFATNPQIDLERSETDLAREGLEQARSRGRPTVNLNGSAGYEYIDTTSPFAFNLGDRSLATAQVQAVQPIYTGGGVSAGIRQAKAGINAADSQYEAVQQDLVLSVVTAYVDVRKDRETVAIRKNNVDVNAEQVRAANDRFDVGVVTRTDVALANARQEGAKAALAGAEATLEGSEANYELLIGKPPGDLVPPPPIPPLPASFDEAVLIALDNNPDIKAARHGERAANEAIKVARAQYRPQLSIVGSAGVQETYGSDSDQRDTSVSAVAQGTIPLLSGGLIKSQVSSARLQRDQARNRVDLLERQVRAQVAQAWYGYSASLRSIEASRRQVDAAEIAYAGAQEELAVGVRTTLDVLDQEQQLFEARLALVQSERDAYVAAYRLLRAAGQLDKHVAPAFASDYE
jgi:outer membrane protein